MPAPGPGWGGRGQDSPGHPAPESTAPTAPTADEPDLFSALADDSAPSDAEQVIALERSLLTDEVRSDPAAVAALLHPQWSEVGRSGRLWTREAILDEIGPLEEDASLDVLSCMPVGPDAMLLLWRSVTDSGSTLRSSLWVRERGHWQQLFHQGTAEA